MSPRFLHLFDWIVETSTDMNWKAYMFYRTALSFYLHYDSAENPLQSITWTFPLRLAAWLLVFDYFFYVYHRSCHEFDFLWSALPPAPSARSRSPDLHFEGSSTRLTTLRSTLPQS